MKYLPLIHGETYYERTVQLGDYKLKFTFKYNEISDTYYMDMACQAEDFEVFGVHLVGGVDLFGVYSRQYGGLFVLGPEDFEPSLESFGDQHQLVWLTGQEMDANGLG